MIACRTLFSRKLLDIKENMHRAAIFTKTVRDCLLLCIAWYVDRFWNEIRSLCSILAQPLVVCLQEGWLT